MLLGVPCASLALVLPLPGVVVAGGAGWGGGAGGPGLGVGGLESLAEGLGGVGGAEALDRIAEEGLPCRLRHDGLRGGLVGWRGCGCAHPGRYAPCAPLRAFLLPRATSPSGSWPLKQGRMRDLSQLTEDLEQKITTWQKEVDLKLMKSVWGAHVRTPEEEDLLEECVCEPPRACLCCHRPPEMVERDLLYAYQGLKDTTKGGESVEDHLPASITQGASNLHSNEDMEDKIKLLYVGAEAYKDLSGGVMGTTTPSLM